MLKTVLRRSRCRKSPFGFGLCGDCGAGAAAWLYSQAGVPDTVSGRFDMIVLHLALVLERLRDGGPAAQVFSQALLETMFADMDQDLREMGLAI